MSTTELSDLPDELFDAILGFLFSGASARALQDMPCYVHSQKLWRQRRRLLAAARSAVHLGCVCQRFCRMQHERRDQWKGSARALWIVKTFAVLRQVGDKALWSELMNCAPDEDFEWERGSWRHKFALHPSASKLAVVQEHGHFGSSVRDVWQRAEADLRALATRGRAIESMGELLQVVDRATQRLRTTLKDMVLLWRLAAFPSGTPMGIWHEVQICAALWLTTLLCVRDVVREARLGLDSHTETEPLGHNEFNIATALDLPDADWYHVQPGPVIRALWDHVHNGVTTDYYWSTMRPSNMARRIDYQRFVRIWRRAQQHAQCHKSLLLLKGCMITLRRVDV